MNLIFDVILGAIMLSIIFISYKKGFVASVLSLASVFISAVATFIFYRPFADYLNSTFISEKFTEFVRNKISDIATDGNVEAMLTEMPQKFRDLLNAFGVSPDAVREGFEASGMTAVKYADAIATDIAQSLSYTLSCGIAIFSIFIGCSIVCAIASFFINSFFKLPILDTANKMLGLCIGVVCALTLAWVFSYASILLFDTFGAMYPEQFNKEILESSIIINFFATFNPIQLFNKLS